MVVLMVKTYYSKRRQKNEPREGHMGKVGGTSTGFKAPLPGESHRMHLIPLATGVTTLTKCCLPGKLIRDSAPRAPLGVM